MSLPALSFALLGMAIASLALTNKTLVQLLAGCSGCYKATAASFYKQASISGSVAIG